MHLEPSFLAEGVDAWPSSEGYQESLASLQAVKVVNDWFERGVKLSYDFVQATKEEEYYQNILQVIDASRKQDPCLRKRAVRNSVIKLVHV